MSGKTCLVDWWRRDSNSVTLVSAGPGAAQLCLVPRAGSILETILYRGELPRGDVAHSLSTGARRARRTTSAFLGRDSCATVSRGVLIACQSLHVPLRETVRHIDRIRRLVHLGKAVGLIALVIR